MSRKVCRAWRADSPAIRIFHRQVLEGREEFETDLFAFLANFAVRLNYSDRAWAGSLDQSSIRPRFTKSAGRESGRHKFAEEASPLLTLPNLLELVAAVV